MAAGKETLLEKPMENSRNWAMEVYKGKEIDVVEDINRT
jgi:hypothetical protein